MTPLATLVERAGLAQGTPVALARVANGATEDLTLGTWPNGSPVAPTDRFYVASLAKQITGAAMALLVRAGYIDPDQPLATYISGLPPWSATVTPRHLAHHTAGLPPAGEIERLAPGDWTEDFAFRALRELPELQAPPGTAYAYSNLGYILLARLIAKASGQPFAQFVRRRLFEPLSIDGMGFETNLIQHPQSLLMGPRLPLTHGDGGLWSTASGLAEWLRHQGRDTLGIAALVETPGRLNNGQRVDYGWGLGLREYEGTPLLIHGGGWTGAVAKTVRSPALGVAVVGMAAGTEFEALNQLVAAALDDMAR
jgi:CubicO group peptidase (beta-lactamase class C family)